MFFSRAICFFVTVMSFSLYSLSSPLEPVELEVQKRQVPGLADVTGVVDEGRALFDTFLPEIADLPSTTSVEETDLPPLLADVIQVFNNMTTQLIALGVPLGSVTPDDTLIDLIEGMINDVASMADNLQNNSEIADIGTLLQPIDIAMNGWMAFLFATAPELLDDIIAFFNSGSLVSEFMSLDFDLVLLLLGFLTV